jgi:dienelactone hydrolase
MSCPDCFTGNEHSGTLTGKEVKIHGRDSYVAEPPGGVAPKGIVVIVPDAFGWAFVNNRLLADAYATKGRYLVYLPDFMNGMWLPAMGYSRNTMELTTESLQAEHQRPG